MSGATRPRGFNANNTHKYTQSAPKTHLQFKSMPLGINRSIVCPPTPPCPPCASREMTKYARAGPLPVY